MPVLCLMFIYAPIHLSIYSSIHLSIYPSIHLYIYPSIHLPIYPSTHLPIYPSTHLPIYPSTRVRTTRVAFFRDSYLTRVNFIFFGNDSTRVTFLKMTRLDWNFVLTTRLTFRFFSIKKPANLLTVCRIFACMRLS